MAIPDKFTKGYEHKKVETDIYHEWEESGYFNPDVCIEKGVTKAQKETFSIVLPPPNVTGRLHIGHSAMLAIEDIIVRFNRMRGLRTLWIPGTDHAAIATQAKYEKELYKNTKKSRHDFTREEFFNQVNAFALDNQSQILTQLKAMGASLDWSRLSFTLDKEREIAVRTAFKKMYDNGLIYQKYRVINWDPKGQTTVSDDEVEHEESEGILYTFKYSHDFPISIATTRPETKVGDTAVAVHPDDKRYQEFIGKTYTTEFAGTTLEIKIIADEQIDPEFGTGAVGVTPAHSITDWELSERHNLSLKPVINEYAKMREEAGSLVAGLKTKEAREQIVIWLKEKNLLEKEENIRINISTAQRTGGVIEPLPKLQWFIDVNKKVPITDINLRGIEKNTQYSLKELMRAAVATGQIQIVPERFERIYFNWIDSLRDWCISRQILYGHRIPVWYKDNEIYVGIEDPKEDGWLQDEDTLDTWFSSGLWTFSTLGWPQDSSDLQTYHPTALLETGYDILFFWVARMILMSTYLVGDIPFKTVYLHGMVRDKQGRKMSKSLGNVVDPIDFIEQYGADALRMSLIIGVGPGSDMNLDENNVRGYRKFANKVWNIARFILENLPENYLHTEVPSLLEQRQAYLEELTLLEKEVTSDLEHYRLHLAGEKIYHYIWHTLADSIVEEQKQPLKEGSLEEKHKAAWILVELFSHSLKLLHPFMPFVTEEIWKHMPTKSRDFLMVESWPL